MNNFVAGLTGYAVIGVAVLLSNRGRKKLREAKLDLNPALRPFATPRTYPLGKHIALYTLVGLATIALWPLLVAEAVKEAIKYAKSNTPEAHRKSRVQDVQKSWLRNRITVQEAEAKHLVDFSLGDDPSEQRLRAARLKLARIRGLPLDGKPVPFGFANRDWRELLAVMQQGDELWEFSSSSSEHLPPGHFRLFSRAGIALVRNGEIIDCITTMRN